MTTTSSNVANTTTPPLYNPSNCNSTFQVALENDTCVPNSVGQVC
jgi:hypothetical protein